MKGIKRNQIHKPGLTEKAVLCSTVHRCTSLRIFRPAAAWSSLASERPWIWPLLCCCRGCWRCSRTTGLHKFIARSACRLKSRHKINTPQQTADVRYVGTGTFKANTLKQFRVGLKFQVLKMVNMLTVNLYVTQCSLAHNQRRFARILCLHSTFFMEQSGGAADSIHGTVRWCRRLDSWNSQVVPQT